MKSIKYDLTTGPAPNIRYKFPKHGLKGRRKDFEKKNFFKKSNK